MLPIQFFGQNLHFVVSLLAALTFFAIFWLHLDAWQNSRAFKEVPKFVGFLLLSISFLISSTLIEHSVLGSSLLGSFGENLSLIVRLLGYLSLLYGLVIDPLPTVPQTEGLDFPGKTKSNKLFFGIIGGFLRLPLIVGAFAICGLYWRRATLGLEKHLKPVAVGFFLLGLFEFSSSAALLRNSSNPSLVQIIQSFGLIWMIEHILLLAATAILAAWVWKYLITRLQAQLFIIFTTTILLIFLLTTTSFTFLLMGNIQKEALENLNSAGKVLNFALDNKRSESSSNAEAIAANPQIVQLTKNKDGKALKEPVSKLLKSKNKSTLLITDSVGQVLARGEDPDRVGDSISSDPLVQRALLGTSASNIFSKEDVLAPVIYIQSAVPLREGENIVGSVVVGQAIDDSFVDGIKASTGLDSGIYSGNIRSATTFVAADGKSRWIGLKEENPSIKKKVLEAGETFTGTSNQLNRAFLVSFLPLKDVDNQVVGMIFVGRSEASILKTAGQSIQITFLVTALLLLLSIFPAFLVSRYISRQISR